MVSKGRYYSRTARFEIDCQLEEFYEDDDAYAFDEQCGNRMAPETPNVTQCIDLAALMKPKSPNPKKRRAKKNRTTRLNCYSPEQGVCKNSSLPPSEKEENTRDETLPNDHPLHDFAQECVADNVNKQSIASQSFMYQSVLGPQLRGSMVLSLENIRSIIAVLYTSDSVRVIPVVVDSNNDSILQQSLAWIEQEIARRISFSSFESISAQLLALRPELPHLVDAAHSLCPKERGHERSIIDKAFDQAGVVVGADMDSIALFTSWIATNAAQKVKAQNDDPSPTESNNKCLVCFDVIPQEQDISIVRPCGHHVCVECWTDYIRSTALSGMSTISCPGFDCDESFNCEESLSLFDMAHILFRDEAMRTNNETNALFRRLVNNKMESFCITEIHGRFCPSPSCGRLLVPPSAIDNKSISGSGWNILQCTCGTSLCADCSGSERSHPGVSCAQYKKLQEDIRSGKADDEYESQKYVLERSRPCPRCRFPIEKSGGCNHMRCSTCSNYFCWHCGGPGHECMAYFCRNRGKHSHEKPDDELPSGFESLLCQVRKYRSYRQSEKCLVGLDRRVCDPEENCLAPSCTLARQVLRAILWLKTWLVAKSSSTEEDCPQLQSLEMIFHALDLRQKIVENMSHKQGEKVTELDVAKAMGLVISNKQVSKRKQQTLDKRNKNKKVGKDFAELVADDTLRDLCMETEENFERAALQSIRSSIQFLKTKTSSTTSSRRRKKKQLAPTIGLNEKMHRATDPWKIGMRAEKPNLTEIQEKKVQWKGKTRTKALRVSALAKV